MKRLISLLLILCGISSYAQSRLCPVFSEHYYTVIPRNVSQKDIVWKVVKYPGNVLENVFTMYLDKGTGEIVCIEEIADTCCFEGVVTDTFNYSYKCTEKEKRKVSKLVLSAVLSSSYLAKRPIIGYDCESYEFMALGFSAYCDETSGTPGDNCSMLMDFVESLFQSIKSGNESMIKQQIDKAVPLTAVFKSLYPSDVKHSYFERLL